MSKLRAVIVVPFYDTLENNRAKRGTIETLKHLLDTIDRSHTVIPVDNGSTDKRGTEFARKNFPDFLEISEPMSISEGVNSGWRMYQDELINGEAVAIKHDNDLVVTSDEWVDALIDLFCAEPDIYLAGPRNALVEYSQDEWGLHMVDRGSYYESQFIYGGVQARSPLAFRDIGYARQPYGKWGYGDHWDTWRVKRLGKRLAVLKDYEFEGLVGHSALERDEKNEHRILAKEAFLQLQRDVIDGKRTVYERFSGWRP
jgi:hypothetical protein